MFSLAYALFSLALHGLSIIHSYPNALLVEAKVSDNWHENGMFRVTATHGLEMHSCGAPTPSCLIRGLSPATFYNLVAHACVKTAPEIDCDNIDATAGGYTLPERKMFLPYRMRQKPGHYPFQ